MYLHLAKFLPKNGYRQYEISNFAKTGCESRHNLKYWMGREYIGFGPGAHSDIAGHRFSLVRDLETYISSTPPEGRLVEDLSAISTEERAREYLMLRLRTMRGVEEWEYRREFFLDFEPIQRQLEDFVRRGLAEQTGHRWRLTPEGFLVSNQIIGQLMDHVEAGSQSLFEAPSLSSGRRTQAQQRFLKLIEDWMRMKE